MKTTYFKWSCYSYYKLLAIWNVIFSILIQSC